MLLTRCTLSEQKESLEETILRMHVSKCVMVIRDDFSNVLFEMGNGRKRRFCECVVRNA